MHNSYCSNQVNKYYDLVTGFFEYGWGKSFHFAGRSATYTYLSTITSSVLLSQLRCRVALDHSFGNFTASVPRLYFRYPDETFHEAIKRHEHFMALQLGLKKGMKVSGEA